MDFFPNEYMCEELLYSFLQLHNIPFSKYIVVYFIGPLNVNRYILLKLLLLQKKGTVNKLYECRFIGRPI